MKRSFIAARTKTAFLSATTSALAMRRLSIIDLAGGKQPIHNTDKTKWIVFNSEIYNYQSFATILTAAAIGSIRTLILRSSCIFTTYAEPIACSTCEACSPLRSGTRPTVRCSWHATASEKTTTLIKAAAGGDIVFRVRIQCIAHASVDRGNANLTRRPSTHIFRLAASRHR